MFICLPKVAFFSSLQPANISMYNAQRAADACANQPKPTFAINKHLSQSSGFTFGLEEAEDVVFADCGDSLAFILAYGFNSSRKPPPVVKKKNRARSRIEDAQNRSMEISYLGP